MESQTACTTSASLYEVQLAQAISSYEQTYTNKLKQFVVPTEVPTDITEIMATRKKYTGMLQELTLAQPPALNFDAIGEVNKYYNNLEDQETRRKSFLESLANEEKNKRQQQYEQDVARANQHNKDLLIPIQQKHELLLQHKKNLAYVFDHYGITPLDVSISDNITFDEFSTLIDSAVEVCEKYQKREGKIFSYVTQPLKGNTNLLVTTAYCLLLVIIAWLVLPLASIPIFGLFCYALHGMYQDIDKLRIASALMTQTDYQRFVSEQDMAYVGAVTTEDIDERLAEDLKTIKSFADDRAAAIAAVRGDSSIAQRCTEITGKVKALYAERTEDLKKYIKAVTDAEEDYLSKIKRFPAEQKNCLMMCHDFVLSRTPETIDVLTPLPFQNFVFKDDDHRAAIDLCKLYLCNTLLNVQVKQLTVEIYDPITMCADFTEFLTKDTQAYIKPNSGTLDDLMKTYRKYSQENVIALHGKTIDEFNTDAEIRELPPVEYKLLILVSGLDGLQDEEKRKEFDPFFDFSMKNGVWMWLFSKEPRENSLFIDGTQHTSGEPIQYTWDIGDATTMIYSKALEKFKDRGIDYVVKYGDKFIPRSKWWTWDTIHEIYMPIGLMDGDPTKGLNVAPAVGDANVHSLLAGATGAGKSAAINEMLMSLITMYPPSELQLVYVDFKNVEAAKFTRGFDKGKSDWMDAETETKLKRDESYYTRLSRIPHLRIISGTTDGEYALSIFNFLMDEMARRQKIINKAGVTKLEEMRKQILSRYNEEHSCKKTWAEMRNSDWNWYQENVINAYGGELPRLLIILDEFQVMFNPEFVDPRIIDQINGKITAITKLARAMGCHFWFTSQSMKGTMSQDTMGNFSLRMALRCSSEVSTEIIGNPASGTIKAKFGYMYSNDSAGQDATANRLWRVPFLDEKKMKDYIDPLYDMLKERHEVHNMAEFYDEKVLVPRDVLAEWYDNYGSFDDPRCFILGELAGFSVDPTPLNINLGVDDGEGFLVSAFDREDLLNLTLTLLYNIRRKEDDATVIINCMDKDVYNIMGLENYVDERFESLSGPDIDVDEFVEAIRQQIDMRKAQGAVSKPLYIVLIMWEKCPGIGVDNTFKLSDKFKAIVRDGPAQGVHFILAMREKAELPRAIASQLKHKVCGQLMSDQSSYFMNSTKVEKLPSHASDSGLFALYEYGTTLEKFRIYQHPLRAARERSVKELKAR